MPLDIKLHIDNIRKMYHESPQTKMFHGLIIGEKGAGKTSLLKTFPKPILVHSFDPGGTEVLNKEIEDGSIIVDNRFESDTFTEPKAYIQWEDEFRDLRKGKAFESLGTYCIDSITTLCQTMLWQIMKKEGRIIPGMRSKLEKTTKGMRIQDWGTLLTVFQMLSRSLASLPCHTVIMGHVSRDHDEALQTFVRGLLLPGQAKDQVPVMLSEFYVLQVKETAKGLKRTLLTQHSSEYRATTRMGHDGLFKAEEEPDVRRLLELAGYPFEDKEMI